MNQALFLQPLDVLFLRGNRLFDGAGAFGEALMPPWPSLAAGALRSRMLADAGVDAAAFAGGERIADPALNAVLGTPEQPGTFRVARFTLARRTGAQHAQHVEALTAAPADLLVTGAGAEARASYLTPRSETSPIRTSAPLDHVPVPQSAEVAKPETGLWLTERGWARYLAGDSVATADLVRSDCLWALDHRLGIALDPTTRTAESGMLYTTDAVALRPDVGFLVDVQDAHGLLPRNGLLRFGGDGRGAAIEAADARATEPDQPVWETIQRERRFRLVLTTPGISPSGWRPPGLGGGNTWAGPDGVRARLASAAVPRHAVVSGWDLARRRPKAAVRATPTGAVYWFDKLEGGVGGLRRLAEQGSWACMADDDIDAARRAEGFNNVAVAAWPRPETLAGMAEGK